MAVCDVVNTSAAKVGDVELNDALFAVEVQPGILHEVVCMQRASIPIVFGMCLPVCYILNSRRRTFSGTRHFCRKVTAALFPHQPRRTVPVS